jgi:hypothetical protein
LNQEISLLEQDLEKQRWKHSLKMVKFSNYQHR